VDIPEPKASSQVLNEAQIFELAELILRIENHYGFPCDIEWAYEAEHFYITQSRPITTLTIKKSAKRKLELYGYRDFTLALLQMGLEAESGPLPYLDNAILTRPYFVGERKNGVTALFIDNAQVEWQKEEILKRIEDDNDYIRKIIQKFEKDYLRNKEILEAGMALPREAFSKFVEDMAVVWREAIGWWWAIEILEQKNIHPEFVAEIMAVRKRTEKFAPAIDGVARATIFDY